MREADRLPVERFLAFTHDFTSRDPLTFPGYRDALERAARSSGASESVRCGHAEIAGRTVVAIDFAFAFMGGSVGEAAGRRIVHAVHAAADAGVPLVSFVASGGARVQEGMRSLVQLQAIAAALSALRARGAPHLAVLRHPTTGGVWASLAAGADVVVAERGATVAFAGARVRGDVADSDAFLAEGRYASGAVDALASADELPGVVARYVEVLAAVAEAGPPVPCEPPAALPGAGELADGWEAVRLARGPLRPRADAYLDAHFEQRAELTGDRAGGRDPGLRCGIGMRDGRPCAYIAQTGSPTSAAGYRTATRLLSLAESWRIPVLTLIDTPGAANDAAAERDGVGTAIAQAFATVAALTTPITSLVVGEGGSGGALALAAPGNLWAVPSSYFSVIAPEGAAAIIHRDPGRAAEVADQLRIGPAALVALGVVRGIVGTAGATGRSLRRAVSAHDGRASASSSRVGEDGI